MATIQESMAKATQLHQAGHLREAEQLYLAVVAADPTHTYALNNLGILASQADRPEEAMEYLRRALSLEPDVAEFHGNLAVAYQAAHGAAVAIAEFREALRLKPTSAQCHTDLGEALLELGQLDEALVRGQEALRLQPDFAPAYAILGQCVTRGRYVFSDEEVRRMQALLEAGGQSPEHAVRLHFTLAAWWDRQGDYDAAFRGYCQGNDFRREIYRRTGRTFDPEKFRAKIDALMAGFTAESFERMRGRGVASERPVFVVGMIRSGTSLVEQILASHPLVFGCGELKDIDQLSRVFYPACTRGIDAATVHRLADSYLGRLLRLAGPAAVRAIDKLPTNFVHLGMIAMLFPQARVIHCRRNPLDVCVSAFVQNFQHVPYATRLEDLGFFHRQYERLMEHWRRVLPLRMHEVVYEDLVADQERISRELVAFCGLPWDDRCLAFHKNPRAVKTVSRLQVRQPIYTHAVGRWKRFESHLGPLRDALAGGGKG
jgi:tetratricopeptide (TPR) repeat protein